MKRDMDLIRKMLLAVAEHDGGYAPKRIEVDGYSQEQIAFHAFLLIEANLASGADTTHMQSPSPSARITRLTWAGYDFLDSSRDPGIWQQAKATVEKVGGASFEVWTAVLTDLVKRAVGL